MSRSPSHPVPSAPAPSAAPSAPVPSAPHLLSAEELARALALRDLTDRNAGPHAMQLLLGAMRDALATAWRCPVAVHRAHPVVSIADNYDRLCYPAAGAARDARYTRYVGADRLLRSHTTAMVPDALRAVAADGLAGDLLLVCPGLVYRRDSIDRLHTGEPHQVDLWRLRAGRLDPVDLLEMVRHVVEAALPGATWRCTPTRHPYTEQGLQIDVRVDGPEPTWIEVLECGMVLPAILDAAGLDPCRVTGLAMGVGLDRLLMLRKAIDDIRLLRATDPRVASQMLDLSPYRPVSSHPPIRRDLSVAVPASTTAEDLGDRVRAALGPAADCIEEVAIVSETRAEALPPAARERLGIAPGQVNILLRIVLRHPDRTLTHEEANLLRDQIYAAIHQGSAHQWSTSHWESAVPDIGIRY